MTPDPRRSIKERIFQLLEQHPKISPHARSIAHDKGERIVSAYQLEQPLELSVDRYDEGTLPANAKPYKVEITLRNILDPQELMK